MRPAPCPKSRVEAKRLQAQVPATNSRVFATNGGPAQIMVGTQCTGSPLVLRQGCETPDLRH